MARRKNDTVTIHFKNNKVSRVTGGQAFVDQVKAGGDETQEPSGHTARGDE